MGKKVTIIGAGSVGSTIAYTMAVNGIATEIVMIDINEAKAMGEALDIRQAFPSVPPSRSTRADTRTRRIPTSSS